MRDVKQLTDSERASILTQRRAGLKFSEIATELDLSPKAVEYICLKAGVKLDSNQRKTNTQTISQSLVTEVESLRLTGMRRKVIAAKLGITEGTIKTIIRRRSTVRLSPEQAQANAYEAKLELNPNAMAEMRKSLTPEVVARRSISIAEAYQDPALRAVKGEQSHRWWASLEPKDRQAFGDSRRGAKSGVVRAILASEGFADMAERCSSWAAEHQGQFLGPYTNGHDKARWTCLKGHEFLMQPYVVGLGHWCARCANRGPSSGQLEMLDYVRSLGFEADSSRVPIAPKELDIYVPAVGLGIEYNGLYWHSTGPGDQILGRHGEKARLCREANIKLLAIFQDEWANSQDLVKAMIRWRLGCFNGVALNARDLTVKKLEYPGQCKDFFERNHLDGYAVCSLAWGLYLGDKLISCASFRINAESEFELARLATDYDYQVRGGAGRLLAQVLDRDLVSYSNNRLGNGNIYQSLGFKLVSENRSGYWYTDGTQRISRWKCMRINDPVILAQYPEVEHTEKAQAEAGLFSLKLFGTRRSLFKIEDYGHRKWIRTSPPFVIDGHD